MSVEEEVELRDMVAQTLELNGCLPKIKAQLRANLFLALDEDSKICKQQPLMNSKIKSFLEDPDAQLMFSLVREFLDYFDLDFTASVYEPESYLGSLYKYEGRQKITEELGLKGKDGPLLLHLLKIAQTKSKTLKINLTNINGEPQKSSISSSVESSRHDQINGHLENFNQTDNISKSRVEGNGDNIEEKPLDVTYLKKDLENDDTFNGTSSIEEDALNGDDGSHKSVINDEESAVSPEQEISPDSKTRSEEKKSSKSDKLKTKLELPPLQLSKGRGSDILPSLYKKSNKEYDFEIKEDYEEDFSELELSQSKIDSPKLLFEELQCSENTSNGNSISSKKKSFFHLHSHSNSDNKLNSNSVENIETNLSLDGSVSSKINSENT